MTVMTADDVCESHYDSDGASLNTDTDRLGPRQIHLPVQADHDDEGDEFLAWLWALSDYDWILFEPSYIDA